MHNISQNAAQPESGAICFAIKCSSSYSTESQFFELFPISFFTGEADVIDETVDVKRREEMNCTVKYSMLIGAAKY